MDILKELNALFTEEPEHGTFAALESALDDSRQYFGVTSESNTDFAALESALDTACSNLSGYCGVEGVTFAALESLLDSTCATISKYCHGDIVTFAALEALIDNATSNLTSDFAMESCGVTEKLLAMAKTKIAGCTTIAACDAMRESIATEATKFNECMLNMASAGRDLKSGVIDSNEFKSRIAPSVLELRASCEVIGIVNESYMDDSAILADENVDAVRNFIIGTESLINARREELESDPDVSLENFIQSCEDMTIASEGATTFALRVRFSEQKKAAKKLTKDAKKSFKEKDFDTAISLYKKAKTAYTGLIGQLNKIPDTELKHVVGKIDGKNADVTVGQNQRLTKAVVKTYFEKKVTACDEAIFKIKNKKDKNTRKATESFDDIDSLLASIATESMDDIDSLLASIALESTDDFDIDDEDDDDDDDDFDIDDEDDDE